MTLLTTRTLVTFTDTDYELSKLFNVGLSASISSGIAITLGNSSTIGDWSSGDYAKVMFRTTSLTNGIPVLVKNSNAKKMYTLPTSSILGFNSDNTNGSRRIYIYAIYTSTTDFNLGFSGIKYDESKLYTTTSTASPPLTSPTALYEVGSPGAGKAIRLVGYIDATTAANAWSAVGTVFSGPSHLIPDQKISCRVIRDATQVINNNVITYPNFTKTFATGCYDRYGIWQVGSGTYTPANALAGAWATTAPGVIAPFDGLHRINAILKIASTTNWTIVAANKLLECRSYINDVVYTNAVMEWSSDRSVSVAKESWIQINEIIPASAGQRISLSLTTSTGSNEVIAAQGFLDYEYLGVNY